MAYHNPLHAPLPSRNQSNYSSLSSACGPTSGGSRSQDPLFPYCKRIPQTKYAPTSKWNAAMSSNKSGFAPVAFDYAGYNGQGVPMRELSARSVHAIAQMLAGGGDPVGAALAGGVYPAIVFKIRWPGYEHIEYSRPINVCIDGKPMNRAQLAQGIAQHFARFMEKAHYEATNNAEFFLGRGGISFDTLVLVSLVHMSDNVWMAEIGTGLSPA